MKKEMQNIKNDSKLDSTAENVKEDIILQSCTTDNSSIDNDCSNSDLSDSIEGEDVNLDFERAQRVADGFRINWMNMSDGGSGKLLWESGQCSNWGQEVEARVPKSILECPSVSREINFSSDEDIKQLKLAQNITYNGHCIEEWEFDFGFVMPNTTNSWQQTIQAAEGDDAMMKAEDISGNIVIETKFYDKDLLLLKHHVRIFYV